MTVYAILYLLLVRAQEMTIAPERRSGLWWLPLAICLVYAATDEFHQSISGGQRTPSVRDVGYDMLGALIVWVRQYKYV